MKQMQGDPESYCRLQRKPNLGFEPPVSTCSPGRCVYYFHIPFKHMPLKNSQQEMKSFLTRVKDITVHKHLDTEGSLPDHCCAQKPPSTAQFRMYIQEIVLKLTCMCMNMPMMYIGEVTTAQV